MGDPLSPRSPRDRCTPGQAPTPGQGLALSIITLAELYEGVYYSRDPEGGEQDRNNFLRGVTVLGLDMDIAKIFGRERGRLRAAGTLIGDLYQLTDLPATLAHQQPQSL